MHTTTDRRSEPGKERERWRESGQRKQKTGPEEKRALGRQNTASRERSAGEGGEKEEEAEMMGLAEV